MYQRIVIAVDGSEEATHAARHGLAFAEQFGAQVELLHVVDDRALRLTRSTAERSQLREQGDDRLETVADLATSHERRPATTLLEGQPAVQISDHVAEEGIDLLVVGKRGTSGFRRRLLGGVAERVVSWSDAPVLVVPPEASLPDEGYPQLLITTDGSENAEMAAPHGAAVAQRFAETLHVVNVVDLHAEGGVFSAGGLEREFVERLEALGEEAVTCLAREFEKRAPDLDIETAVAMSKWGIADGIQEYIEDQDIDFAVMGSHGRSKIRRQVLGSVTASVLRNADVPVLVVTRES